MSLLTPVRVPVKVYRWDDDGAPQMTKSAGGLPVIWEACLVTGYGAGADAKEGAGWTMPFEDTDVKVFRPEVGAERDFFLRCSADTGRDMVAQVYLNMTDANTGELKLQCSRPFRFARGTVSTPIKWVLIASPRGFWFFNEQTEDADFTPLEKSGTYFFAGDVYSQNNSAVFLQHTSGDNAAAYATLLRAYSYNGGRVDNTSHSSGALLAGDNSVIDTDVQSVTQWRGDQEVLNTFVLAPLIINTDNDMFILPGIFTSADGVTKQNFDTVSVASNVALTNTIVFGTGSTVSSNFYISTDFWLR